MIILLAQMVVEDAGFVSEEGSTAIDISKIQKGKGAEGASVHNKSHILHHLTCPLCLLFVRSTLFMLVLFVLFQGFL